MHLLMVMCDHPALQDRRFVVGPVGPFDPFAF